MPSSNQLKITPDTLVVFCLGILGPIQRRWNHTHIDIQWMRILSVHYFLQPLFLMLRDIYLVDTDRKLTLEG